VDHVFAQPGAQAELMVHICDAEGQLIAEVLGLFSFHPLEHADADLVSEPG
jgi:hypothetical protein